MSVSPATQKNNRLQRPDFPLEQRVAEAAAIVVCPRRGRVIVSIR